MFGTRGAARPCRQVFADKLTEVASDAGSAAGSASDDAARGRAGVILATERSDRCAATMSLHLRTHGERPSTSGSNALPLVIRQTIVARAGSAKASLSLWPDLAADQEKEPLGGLGRSSPIMTVTRARERP